MFVDTRTVENNSVFHTDICVIGAGAAGITIAKELIGSRHRVILLESGGLEPDQSTQAIYEGRSIGLTYPLSDTRSRYFGGSTNQWWGNCRPLDDIDFEQRSWIAYSGWPFHKQELLPFYARAQALCKLDGYENYNPETLQKHSLRISPLSLDEERVVTKVIQTCPSVRFKDLYQQDIATAQNVDTFLWSNAIALEPNEPCTKVNHVRAKCLNGNEFSISARIVIVAAGGIENARLLLASNKVAKAGVGNEHDLVGRYFMEHPTVGFSLKATRPTEGFRFYDYDERQHVGNMIVWGMLSLSSDLMRRRQLLGMSIYFVPGDPEGIPSLREIKNVLVRRTVPRDVLAHLQSVVRNSYAIGQFILQRKLLKLPTKSLLPGEYSIATLFEQAPNPSNRVTLSSERDALNQLRTELRLQLSEAERENYVESLRILAEAAGWDLDPMQLKVGHGSDPWRIGFFSHHMGTTRMNDDPKKGVVDRHCRVHGISNLFIAGSSVFPTGGSSAPTLTLVALAIRLTDHLKDILH
jgi:choline dehydrogenase-like flavoprotein